MALEHPRGSGDGCLTVAIRMPVRIVAFAVVLPLRLLWDALATAWRGACAGLRRVWRRLLLPPLHALAVALGRLWRALVVIPAVFLIRYLVVVPLTALWRYVLAPVGRGVAWTLRYGGLGLARLFTLLVVVPLTALWRYVLAPAGRAVRVAVSGLGAGVSWLGHHLLVVPARLLRRSLLVPAALALAAAVVFVVRHGLVRPVAALWRYVLAPAGRGVRWALRMTVLALVWPAVFVWARVIVPVAREIGVALGFAWRAAGYVSRAVGRGLKWLGRVVVVIPAAWVWQRTGAPAVRGLRAAGRWYRRAVLQPIKEAVAEARRTLRQLRAETRRALFGKPPGAGKRLPSERAGHEPGAFGPAPAPAPATDGPDLFDRPAPAGSPGVFDLPGPGDPAGTLVAEALSGGPLTAPVAPPAAPRHRKELSFPSPTDLPEDRPPGHR
jgi:hypothetical protein